MTAQDKTNAIQRKDLPVTALVEQSINPNKMTNREFDLLVDNLNRTGITDPILVRPLPDGKYRIVGGHHRFKAATYLGFSEVPCTIIDHADFDADEEQFQLVRMNAIKGKLDPNKFFELYSTLAPKYTDQILQDAFGFAEEAEFQRLINQSSKVLPTPALQQQFKEAAAEIKTIDGLSKLLNSMFCYDVETEFLARDGWHPYTDYVPGMTVAVYDQCSDTLVWTDKVTLHVFDAEEDLYCLVGKSTDVLVTRGHKMLRGDIKGGNWSVTPVERLCDHSGWSFKTRCQPDLGGVIPKLPCSDPVVFMELVAWYVAEGHLHSGNSTAICITQKRSDGLLALHDLTTRAKLAGVSVMGPYVQTCGTEKVYFNGMKEWFEVNCGRGSLNKKLPDDFLSLPEPALRTVFETLMLGDGHWREEGYGSYASLSKKLADQVQVIALRLGYKAYLFEQAGGIYVVSITSGCGYTTVRPENVTRDFYSGKVWCFETPTGFFVTRRNGKISFHGNTKYGDTLPYGYMIIEYGGQQSVWLRASQKTMSALDLLGIVCVDNKRTMDDLIGGVVQKLAKGELAEVLNAVIKGSPEVALPSGFAVAPTKENLEKISAE